jgi:hypothetical protein
MALFVILFAFRWTANVRCPLFRVCGTAENIEHGDAPGINVAGSAAEQVRCSFFCPVIRDERTAQILVQCTKAASTRHGDGFTYKDRKVTASQAEKP